MWVRSKRAKTTYKGVKVYEEREQLPDLREQKDGTIKEMKKPIIGDVSYVFGDSARYDSVNEVKEAIDRLYLKMEFDTDQEFADCLNERGTDA